jgi:hypothetical protein
LRPPTPIGRYRYGVGAGDLPFVVFGEDRGGHARIALYQPNLPREAPLTCELTVLLTSPDNPETT